MDTNLIIEKEKDFIDRISDKYDYDSNIRHLLYLIIPAFIIKYGLEKEKLILNTFENIRIISSNEKNNTVRAFYSSTPIKVNNEYKTKKFMVINNYQSISLVVLLDNLVHEFNHAINSYNNELKVTNSYIYIRTGLTNRVFKKEDLSFIKKQDSFILEEIINTKQTSDIINIIKSFDSTNNTIYALNNETESSYSSDSYFLQSYICKEILNNKTFISTLEKLRLTGEIDIEDWFDNIVGEKGLYKEFIKDLNEVYKLEIEYTKRRFFKTRIVSRIKDNTRSIKRIIDKFNNSVNFK